MRPRSNVALLKSPLRTYPARLPPIPATSQSAACTWQCLPRRYSSIALRSRLPATRTLRNGSRASTTVRYSAVRSISLPPISGYTGAQADGKGPFGGSWVSPSEKQLLEEQEQFWKQRARLPEGSYPKEIAIVGGGISGLSAAHFIAKSFPQSKITLLESSDRAGGWVKSVKVPIKTDAGEEKHVLFEYGPRTLRPGQGTIGTLQLIQDLGLEADVLTVDADAPAAQNRFIYYPDRLNKMPSPANGILPAIFQTIPLFFSGLMDGFWSIFFEGKHEKRPSSLRDESVGDWISRRIDHRVADNIVSAVLHGIYAGDAYQLSMKSLMPMYWHMEGRYDSATMGIFDHISKEKKSPYPLQFTNKYDHRVLVQMYKETDISPELTASLAPRKVSTFTFKEGMQQLVRRLEEQLRKTENVEILTNTKVSEYKKVENGGETKIELQTENVNGTTNKEYDFVICASPPPIAQSEPLAPPVTVQTVNLFYKTPNLAPVQGFGYLIPQSVPQAQNPERALGVIFDHDATPSFDASKPEECQDTIPGTKLTVMMGGHWWDGWTSYPTDAEAKQAAMNLVKRHLNITAEPDACHVNLSRNCIPQYTVGYEDRLKSLSDSLISQFGGRLRVLGAPYNGVGINDCTRAAWEMALNMRSSTNWKSRTAGLGRLEDSNNNEWKSMPRVRGTARQRARKKDAKLEIEMKLKEMKAAYEEARQRARKEEEKWRRERERDMTLKEKAQWAKKKEDEKIQRAREEDYHEFMKNYQGERDDTTLADKAQQLMKQDKKWRKDMTLDEQFEWIKERRKMEKEARSLLWKELKDRYFSRKK